MPKTFRLKGVTRIEESRCNLATKASIPVNFLQVATNLFIHWKVFTVPAGSFSASETIKKSKSVQGFERRCSIRGHPATWGWRSVTADRPIVQRSPTHPYVRTPQLQQICIKLIFTWFVSIYKRHNFADGYKNDAHCSHRSFSSGFGKNRMSMRFFYFCVPIKLPSRPSFPHYNASPTKTSVSARRLPVEWLDGATCRTEREEFRRE